MSLRCKMKQLQQARKPFTISCAVTHEPCALFKDPIDFSAVIASVLISEMDLSGRWNKFGPYGLQWHMMKSHCCSQMNDLLHQANNSPCYAVSTRYEKEG